MIDTRDVTEVVLGFARTLRHAGVDAAPGRVHAMLVAIGHLYFYPEAHFHLGVAILRLGWAERAAQAFEVALQQRPGLVAARRWLARVYHEYLRQPERAQQVLAEGSPAAPVQ